MGGTPAQTEAGDAVTVSQLLLGPVSTPPTMLLQLVSGAAPIALWGVCCFRLPSLLLYPFVAFLALLDKDLVDKSLTGIPTPDTHVNFTSSLFGPPGGTNLGILEDGGPPSDNGRNAATNS